MPAKHEPTFLVDRAGLAKLLRRRPIGSVVLELLQNAWDEDVRRVSEELTYERGRAAVAVEDDAPEGFADLTHAYTLFAESAKKDDPERRGRFNIGEKLVVAICERAEIWTTKGTVIFTAAGRQHSRRRRAAGTRFSGVIRMRRAEFDEMLSAVGRAIPPAGIETTLNGVALAERKPLAEFSAYLPTEIADAKGYLRRGVYRETRVAVYAPRNGETATLYELGIPVVETGDTWHIDIAQKVPLNTERDNVTPSYLRVIRVAVLNAMAAQLPKEAAAATWVGEAFGSSMTSEEAVRAVLDRRFGERRVITDPSDREAEKRAVAAGYTVIAGGAFNAEQWESIRRAGAALPAGRVTPSPKPFSPDGKPLALVPADEWPEGVADAVERLESLASDLSGGAVRVQLTRDAGWPFAAACGPDRQLYLNIARLGWAWFAVLGEGQLALLIHELAHVRVGDHLSDKYADELCSLGARAALLAAREPWRLRR